MKKSLLIALMLTVVMLKAQSQNSNSDISAPVVIDTQNPLAQVLSPNGGEAFNITLPLIVTWAASDDHLGALPVKIGFSTTENGMPTWFDQDFPNTGQIELLPPQEATTFARVFVKLTDTFGNETTDESDGYFTLAGCQPISVWAGDDVTICEENAYFIDQAVAQNFNYANWQTIDGSGYFSDETSINPTYFPSETDYLLGCITLVLEVSSADPCPGFASDTMEMCFQPRPVAFAGPNMTACEGDIFMMNGEVQNAGSFLWETSGDGYFEDPINLNSVYTPGPLDILIGHVSTTLTAFPYPPCPNTDVDTLILNIIPGSFSYAGEDGTIYQGQTYQLAGEAENYLSLAWTTSGNGTFNSTTIPDPVYTPGTNDIINGQVQLCLTAEANPPCVPWTSCMNLNILEPLNLDSLALVALYNATNGPYWDNKTNWLTGPLNTWYGITVSNGRVGAIELAWNNLEGYLPPEIGNLSNLENLSLGYNQLSGNIPSEIGSLNMLNYLNLESNIFEGGLPAEIGNLYNLQLLVLRYNCLLFDLAPIPGEIWNLTNLWTLDLSGCCIEGNIPPEIVNLTYLSFLDLSGNNLTGSIPVEIGSLTNLFFLNLSSNQLSGTIPEVIGNLSNLHQLFLSNNNLIGDIPNSIGNLTLLFELKLSYNQLSGDIPVEIGNLINLFGLEIANNQLSGNIPTQIGNLIYISSLDLSNNQLSAVQYPLNSATS